MASCRPRRGTHPHRAVADRHRAGDRARRGAPAGPRLRHLAGDAPAARQRRARSPAPHLHRPRPAQHPRRRQLPDLAARPQAQPGTVPAGRRRLLGRHRARRLPGPGLPVLGRPARALPGVRHPPGPIRASGAAASQDQRWELAAGCCTTTPSTRPTGPPGAWCCSTASSYPGSLP